MIIKIFKILKYNSFSHLKLSAKSPIHKAVHYADEYSIFSFNSYLKFYTEAKTRRNLTKLHKLKMYKITKCKISKIALHSERYKQNDFYIAG